jgi:putative ABC transport system permease protein
MLPRFFEDFRIAARSLSRELGFSVVAVLTFALGLGAVTAVFAVVNAIYFVPLPYAAPDRLAMIWEDERGVDSHWTVAPANYAVWKNRLTSFDELAGFNVWFPSLTGLGEAEQILGSVVTPEFFHVLGLRPALGRTFTPDDARPDANRVVVLSHGFWERRFGADSGVLGRTIRLSGRTYSVVGVLAPGYKHPEPEYNAVQVWAPISADDLREGAEFRWLRVIGRLRSGVALSAAKREVAVVARQLEQSYPVRNRGWGANVVPLRDELYAGRQRALLLVMSGAAFVLLIVIVNVANLMLARGLRKTRQFAIRAALGAGRARLIRLVLAESVLLAVVGGLLGIALVLEAGDALRALQQRYISAVAELRVDAHVTAFVLIVSLLTAVGAGLIAALSGARTDVRRMLAEGSAATGSGRRARRIRRLLIAGELALTTVLLIASALLTRSFVRLANVSPGFSPDGVLTVEVSLPEDRYPDRARVTSAYDALVSRLRALPNVSEAAATSDLPFTPENRFVRFGIPGVEPAGGKLPLIEFRDVSPGYFRLLRIPLLTGETPDAARGSSGIERVAVNERLASRFWPGRSPIGAMVTLGDSASEKAVVVGVVGNELDDGFDTQPEPRLYLSLAAHPGSSSALMVRTTGDVAAVVPLVRREIATVDHDIALGELRPLAAIMSETISGRRTALVLVAIFGAFALALGAVGIYGVMAYLVGDRTREIALRMALGAVPRDVGRMVFGDSLWIAVIGIGLGAVASLGVSRVLSAFLFETSARDPVSFATVPALVGAVVVVATIIPVRRAIRIAPVEALRDQG